MAAPKGINWKKIEKEYVTGEDSYRTLAKNHGLSYTQLLANAKENEWRRKREEFRENVCVKSIQKAEDSEADRLAKIGIVASKALDRAMKAFEDEEQFNRYIVSTSVGPGMTDMEERIYQKVDTKALKELTATIKDLTSIIRNVYGIPTQAEAEAQRIAAERLELDKKKVDADTDRDVTITVSLPDEMKEYAE